MSRPDHTPDLYDVLGVPRSATAEQIRAARDKLAAELHPDKTGGDPAKTARLRVVMGAYRVLGHAESKADYDKGIAPKLQLSPEAQAAVDRVGAVLVEEGASIAEATVRFAGRAAKDFLKKKLTGWAKK